MVLRQCGFLTVLAGPVEEDGGLRTHSIDSSVVSARSCFHLCNVNPTGELFSDVFRQLPGEIVIGERRWVAVSLVEKTVGTRIEELAVVQNLDAA